VDHLVQQNVTGDSNGCLLMTKGAVSSILKSIKMNTFATSGDEARSRYSSVYSGIHSRPYTADSERYGRSRTVDTSRSYNDRYGRVRYDRSQSRDMGKDTRYRSSGSLDRQGRLYADDYLGRRYGDDRYFEVAKDGLRRDELRQARYGYDRYFDDRFDNFGYNQYSVRPAYDRPRYGYDYQLYDRPTYGRRYGADRFASDNRYGVDRSHFEDRAGPDRFDQPGRVRFDGDRQSRAEDRRRSSSVNREDIPRKESVRSEQLRRTRSLPPRQAEESYYLHPSTSKEDNISDERKFSRTSSTKESFEQNRKSSNLQDELRRESQLARRESDKIAVQRPSSRRESDREQPVTRIEFRDEVERSSRRESEERMELLDRRASQNREQVSRRQSERSASRRESEGPQQMSPQRDFEGREQYSPRHDSEIYDRERRESDDQQQVVYRRESENRQLSSSRRESEGRQLSLSRRESEGRQFSSSRRESEGRQLSTPRRESEGYQLSPSRRESEGRQLSTSRRESEGRQRSPSWRELEEREISTSRRESEGYQLSTSRRESEGRQLSTSRRESEGRQLSTSRRESEGRQLSSSRRESEGLQQSSSRRESDERQQSASRRESEGRQQSLSRRESESREKVLSRRESEGRQGSRRESESQEQVKSRGSSESREQSRSRRESESRDQPSSRRDSREQELSSSRRESEVREYSSSRRESENCERPLSRRESDQHSSPRRESVHERSRKSSSAAERFSEEETQDIKLEVPVVSRSRSQSRSRQGSDGEFDRDEELRGESDGQIERIERQGSRTRRTVQFGSQFSRDRMPAPIPPYSEPRSNYPTIKDHNRKDDGRTSIRSRELAVRATYDIMRRRYYEKSVDPSLNPTWLQRGGTADSTYNMSQVTDDVLRVDEVDFRCTENAKLHNTFEYEIVRDTEQPNPVYRRGEAFAMDITFRENEFEQDRSNVFLNFYFGPNPSVPKLTRVVLPIRSDYEYQRVPHQWDARLLNQDRRTITVEVSIPASCPVGMWRCVVETSSKEDTSARLQYRCAEDIYVIFNPFAKEDAVYMADEDRRQEFVMKDSGKIYTGGYRNVRGRPWIYGQFDDCVISAACVLLEMSGLSHAERGNPVKVIKALTSMIKSSPNKSDGEAIGLMEPRYDDNYSGGNSPHLWTGSVQIIEEFLRLGASPVKYGQCWVMTGLMTTLCRALGLPARPVTAFVSAVDAQDTLTVDRFIDRYGDIQEQGPCSGQKDCVWSFRTWCDVWMQRADLLPEYSGWQALDPSRSFRDDRDIVKGPCGPCPVEALRRGDIGQRDDVDVFFSSMNAYVRYFYEDEESGWGYSPFRQFKYPVSRYVISKSVGRLDEKGDDDCDNLTSTYRDELSTDEDKFSTFNSCRGLKDYPSFEYQAAAHNWMEFDPNETDDRKFDVKFSLETPERVMIGQSFTIPVMVTNNSQEARTMQTSICTRSMYYTSSLGAYLKRSSTQMTLEPEEVQTISLTLNPEDYEDKLLGMSYVKVTVTGFVQETGQSYVDELDFRFNKPWIKIETSDMKVGEESEADLRFTNPLDVLLTDCFLTFEVSGSVRPRTIRINRDIRPREAFTLTHSFIPRCAGERHVVACFASRQLSDVVGHRSAIVHE